jgi:DNA polymerase-3 subunit delta'
MSAAIWDELIGQQAAKEYLRSSLRSGRLAHAYLFKGPTGVGKRTAAYLFAQTVMCHKPAAPDVPCGECHSCRWFAARKGASIEHPDVISLVKFTGADKSASDKLVGDHEPIVRIETVQHVCEQLHRSPMASARRVVIIPEAQRLCRGQAESANAFLKTLEEPPERALIILTSSQREGLLETITSRVQAVHFRRLSGDEIRKGIARARPQSTPESETAAVLADGSLGQALELLHGDLKNWRAALLKELGRFGPRSAPGFGVALWQLADAEGKRLFAEEKQAGKAQADEAAEDEPQEEESEAAAKTEAGWKRYVFRRLLELCEVAFRDALVCASAGAGASSLLLQPDQRKLAESLAANFGAEGCQKALFALREALTAVRLYVRGDVVGRALAGRLADALLLPAAH